MNINVKIVQLNNININIYRLSDFPEEKIKSLVSELNVHYDKINNYIECEISKEKIDIEVIDSLTKLKEIIRLVPPYKIRHDQNSGDFRFGVDLLESVIALLGTEAGNSKTREKLLSLGWELIEKLYIFSLDELVNSSMRYRWLKKNNLIRSYSVIRGRSYSSGAHYEDNKIRFNPTDEDLEKFYIDNKQAFHEYMTFNMADQKQEYDPLTNSEESEYYHYFKSLVNIKI